MPPRTDGAWLSPGAVLAHLGADAASPNQPAVDAARLAAAAYVERVRPDLLTVVVTADGTTVTWDGDAAVELGAVMLAARLYARRSSPQGLASFGEFGPGAILRLDPDVERLIGTGRHARPAVG